ncbi:MAG TPA: hypothetical protein VL282_00845, partial [Tepidisphaeraceae bacterium]|nr:hypothetical protein [Tepidisphaeraceae bacterium]
REQLDSAIAEASSLIDVWPVQLVPHPIHFTGRAVIRPFGNSIAPAARASISRDVIGRAFRPDFIG